MRRGRLNKEIGAGITNNQIFDIVYNACFPLDDTELSLELTDETAPPDMSEYEGYFEEE